ncbi:conserved hypothetical protein [Burkholderia pseudomallei MSHR346]|nr:conserved hypothetical protein [Burkholderia pseudomallei MSHR346]
MRAHAFARRSKRPDRSETYFSSPDLPHASRFARVRPGAPFDGTPSVRRRPERIRGRFSSLFSIPPIDAQSRRYLSQWRRVTQLC